MSEQVGLCIGKMDYCRAFYCFNLLCNVQEGYMGDIEMKKILAGLGIATLVSAAGVSLPSAVHAGSG